MVTKSCSKFWGISHAFTLVELVIASAIFSVLMSTIYLSFHTGIFGYRNIEDTMNIYQSARQILERINLDLRNSFVYSNEKSWFSGNKNETAFLTLVDTFSENNPRLTYAFVSYRLESDKLMRLCRKDKESLNEKSKTQSEEMSSGVEELIFSYGYINPLTQSMEWKDSWDDPKRLPSAVKIRLTIKNKSRQNFERTIFMPQAE